MKSPRPRGGVKSPTNLAHAGQDAGEAKRAHETALAALALPADYTALREICERVAEECRPGAGATLNKMVIDRVLGGKP